MRGFYRVYKSGVLVHESPNLLTTEGRRMIVRYLAGSVGTWAGSIAVGASSVTPTVNDVQLGFEFGRSDVQLRSPRIDTLQVQLRASVDPSVSGHIHEFGLFNVPSNSMTTYPRIVLSTFNPTVQTIVGGTEYLYTPPAATIKARIGGYSRMVTAAASGTGTVSIADLALNLSGFRPEDTFTLALFNENSNAASITLRFMTDDSNYFTHTFTSPATGYQLLAVSKETMTQTGNPTWDNIKMMRVIGTAGAGGSMTLYLDGLSANDLTTYPEYALVSRSVLATPIYKGVNEDMDIEYVLEFS